MSEIKDIRLTIGGIDTDSNERYISPQDYLSAHNIVAGLSDVGGVKNFKGNTLVNYTLPQGSNTTIGAIRNIKENSIIFWVYNDLGNHSILEYYCETNTILPILEPNATLGFTTNFLGFTLENKIHSANIVDDLLFWTDNNVSPRQINKKSARAFLNQTPPSADVFPYSNEIATFTDEQLKIQFVETIKYKPNAPPSVSLGYNPDRKTNYLREKMVQVRYRYVYLDSMRSTWSDGSWITLPEGQESVNGPLSNNTANNFVQIVLDSGHPNVKDIEISVRFGNTEPWGMIDVPIRKYDNDNQRLIADFTSVTYDFYNDSVLVIQPDQIDNFDSVPQVSKTQEIIDNNQLVYANNIEGYENPDLDASVTYLNEYVDMGETTIDMTNSQPINGQYDFYYYNTSPIDEIGFLYIPVVKPDYIYEGVTISFVLRRYDAGPSYDRTYTISYVVTQNDLLNYPIALVESLYNTMVAIAEPIAHGYSQWNAESWVIASGVFGDGEYTSITNGIIIPPISKIMSFKKGAWHPFGIVYMDNQGRDGGVLSGQSLNLYNPYLTEIYPLATLDNQYTYKSHARITINHFPPEWAYKYQIVYAKNDLLKYTQFPIKGNPTPDANGNYKIDCTYAIDYITKKLVDGSLDFQFETGDKIRFIANSDVYVSEYVEAKVVAFDTTTNIMTVTPYSTSQITAGMASPTQEGTLAELYSQNPSASAENRVYFAIGDTFAIRNPATPQRAHAGNIANQNPVSGNPAILDLNRGDCYIYRRYFKADQSLETMVESENFSDFYASKNIDISSIYVTIPNGRTKRYEQGLRHGGRYFPNTATNNICSFSGADFDTLNANYGPINRIVNIGYTLKCLQTKKNTSIYIDRNQIFNADGSYQLATTDKVFGSKNSSELDYGCAHPESVVVNDRQMYFYDVNTGTYIQDSANGMIPVSDYKARTFFRDISQLIKNNPNIYVYSGVDVLNDYVNVTFVDTNITPLIDNLTICFQNSSNRWKTFTDYIPEYYGSNALSMLMFKNGQAWLANSNEVRNSFFGVLYPSRFKTVSNIDYPKVKAFLALAVYSNKTWYSPNDTDITIPSSITYPQGMASRLLETNFRWKEGVAYSEYKRDLLTPNTTNPIINGRKLRGECLVQELRNDDTDEVTLFSIIFHSVPSDMSK